MIIRYRMELDSERHPALVKEAEFDYGRGALDSPEKIVKMLNQVFRMKYLAEETVVMIAFNTRLHPVGLFLLSQGKVNAAMCSPRETYIRALSVGAEHIVICHNHPSGDPEPSKTDIRIAHKLKEAGNLIDIHLADFLVIGNDSYYSAAEEGLFL